MDELEEIKATILGDGRTALIVDVDGRVVMRRRETSRASEVRPPEPQLRAAK